MDYVNDSAAVKAAQLGNRSAFEWLVRRHQQRMYAVALGVLHHHEDARDACQEAFLRAFRGLARFDGHSQFSTWVHRIVVNICIDRLRARSSHASLSIDDVEHVLLTDDDPARAAERVQLGGRIGAALAQLSPSHRTVLVLRELEGLSYQEIADATQCALGTVMSRLFHARKKMQALLVDEEPVEALAA
jgi:RNA polymerase sigma-70 factor (ECF subfamily)